MSGFAELEPLVGHMSQDVFDSIMRHASEKGLISSVAVLASLATVASYVLSRVDDPAIRAEMLSMFQGVLAAGLFGSGAALDAFEPEPGARPN
jgi:hypothetical protein